MPIQYNYTINIYDLLYNREANVVKNTLILIITTFAEMK